MFMTTDPKMVTRNVMLNEVKHLVVAGMRPLRLRSGQALHFVQGDSRFHALR